MKTLPTVTMIFLTIGLVGVSICSPSLLSAHDFLNNFTQNQLIQTVAILVTVSLANVVQIHLEYTRLERRYKKIGFNKSRRTVNLSGLILILALCVSILLAIFHTFAIGSPSWVSFINGAAVLILLQCIFIMYDLIQTATLLAKSAAFSITQPKANPQAEEQKPVSPPDK